MTSPSCIRARPGNAASTFRPAHFLESDPRWPGHVFNTTCLIGPDGILAKYRKVHPWIPWEVHTSPHDCLSVGGPGYDGPMYPVAETEIGRIGAAICYDWLFPEAIRQLALGGAEVLVRVSAYMDPWGAAAPMDWWTLVNRVRALENMAFVVAANQGAKYENYPPFSWPGGSMIVDFDGRILAQAEPGPASESSSARSTWRPPRCPPRPSRHNILKHLRMESYAAYQRPMYSPDEGGVGWHWQAKSAGGGICGDPHWPRGTRAGAGRLRLAGQWLPRHLLRCRTCSVSRVRAAMDFVASPESFGRRIATIGIGSTVSPSLVNRWCLSTSRGLRGRSDATNPR